MEQDHFYIRQKLRPFVNKYQVKYARENGKPIGKPIVSVNQKRLKIKEEIIFREGSHGHEIMKIKARKVFEFAGTYDVILADGRLLGRFHKDFKSSLLRSKWQIFNSDGELIATAQEKNVFVALWRRFCHFIPFISDLLVIIPIPFHFKIDAVNGRNIGMYSRVFWKLRDTYHLDLSNDPNGCLNRHLAVAFAIALDALQDR